MENASECDSEQGAGIEPFNKVTDGSRRTGMMVRTIALLAAWHVSISAAVGQVDAPGTVSPAKELRRLEWMVGTWDIESRDKGSDEAESTGVEVFEWDLGGSFLRGSVTNKGDSEPACRYVVTYDQQEKCYHWWSFSQGGAFNEMTGQVDAEGKTVTWQGSWSEQISHITVVQIPKPGEAVWTTTFKNGDDVLYEVIGKGVRRAESKGPQVSE